jgi:tetratricopeptide (TPR) repeat protein
MKVNYKTLIAANALLMTASVLFAQERLRGQAEGLLAAEERIARPAEVAMAAPEAVSATPEGAGDQESNLFDQGTAALDGSQWDKALRDFEQVIQMHGAHHDGALYWKAYALNKLGRREEALATIKELEGSPAESSWKKDSRELEVEIRQSMGQNVSPENVTDEDLKLIAINSLMNSDPDRAIPLLAKILEGNQSRKVKERALFVLSQTSSPKARAIISSIARGQTDRDLQAKALNDLAIFGGQESRGELADIYAHSDNVEVKRSILRDFMVAGEEKRILTAAKTETNPDLRREAIRQLGVMGAADDLWQLYQSESNQDLKREVIRAMFVGGKTDRLETLAQTEKDVSLRKEAIRSLGLMGARTSGTLAALYQSDQSPDIRKEIMNAFFLQGNAKALVNIARNERDPALRKSAVEKLSLMKSPDATDYMMELLNK